MVEPEARVSTSDIRHILVHTSSGRTGWFGDLVEFSSVSKETHRAMRSYVTWVGPDLVRELFLYIALDDEETHAGADVDGLHPEAVAEEREDDVDADHSGNDNACMADATV